MNVAIINTEVVFLAQYFAGAGDEWNVGLFKVGERNESHGEEGLEEIGGESVVAFSQLDTLRRLQPVERDQHVRFVFVLSVVVVSIVSTPFVSFLA